MTDFGSIHKYNLDFQSVGDGWLVQTDPSTNPETFDHLEQDFGLTPGKTWKQFEDHVNYLQEKAPENVRYKVLYLARHGQGVHNFAELKYGAEWETKWKLEYGDGELVWGPDAELTELGCEQAKANHTAWREQLQKGVPLPQVFYSSPFIRALDTMEYTWLGLMLYDKQKIEAPPLVVEDLREVIGVHTCDKRKTRSHMEHRFPRVIVEDSMTEEDELWTETHRETHDEHDMRVHRYLENLFNLDWDKEKQHTYVSITAHSGAINTFLRVIKHRQFRLSTGGMIPVIIKAEIKK